ncbi:MAG: hypothetical protein L6R37_003048 [Teloschistes peruensis]|nr:MAG: hypothetical protein L6R37_003048 [Teloschistes peruensis]
MGRILDMNMVDFGVEVVRTENRLLLTAQGTATVRLPNTLKSSLECFKQMLDIKYKLTLQIPAGKYMLASDDWAVRVFHCGLKKFCCQSSNVTGSCCETFGKEGGKFSITSVGTPTVLPEEGATKSASVLFAAAQVPSPSTITVTKPLTISSSNQAFSSRNTSSSSTTQPPTKPPTPSPAKQPEHSLSTTQPPTKPPITRPNNPPEQSSNAEPTSKGLIAALSLSSGILAIAALAYAFRRSRKKRRLK